MTELNWQKSTYSEEASSCVCLATAPTGTILLQESDEPGTILTTGASQIRALIAALRPEDSATTTAKR
ncbi:DUF397 domain-containing protein [Streptomyces sp. AC555_RSS877]|uniref:DUF397 domain-containing protein n=1 Tax=Streptomyces sp. AC555_RSS877 TaxID=2823688 RepID=UPI001C270A73|nr:DUF397 domain-containing protein [Streptomyces sp. AC555_RSS877]